MKIVIDARESGTSTGRYVDKLIEYLHILKPEIQVIILTKKHRIDFLKSIAPSFKVDVSDFDEFTFSEQVGLARQLYKLNPDLVHFTMPQQPILYFGKVVTNVHDLTTVRFNNPAKNWLVFKFKQLIYRGVILLVSHKSKLILTISKYVKNDLAHFSHLNQQKIVVAYPAADKITANAEPLKKLVDKQFIMYVGRPQPHKNLRRLIDAFVILQQNHPKLNLVLAGKKDVLFLQHEEFVDQNGLKNIHFTGYVNDAQLRWLYENTAAYVFPSLSEGFGLPGLEAMVHGAPVVSSSATCLPEIYGNAAVYFEPKDVDDMAVKINEVLDNQKLRKKLIETGYKQSKKYSWTKMAEQTLKVYQDTLK